jgi:hypothetical protein
MPARVRKKIPATGPFFLATRLLLTVLDDVADAADAAEAEDAKAEQESQPPPSSQQRRGTPGVGVRRGFPMGGPHTRPHQDTTPATRVAVRLAVVGC